MSTGESREAPPSLASDEPPWMLSENRFYLVGLLRDFPAEGSAERSPQRACGRRYSRRTKVPGNVARSKVKTISVVFIWAEM